MPLGRCRCALGPLLGGLGNPWNRERPPKAPMQTVGSGPVPPKNYAETFVFWGGGTLRGPTPTRAAHRA
eukprot:9194191-Pyramimonas_sp.AAC.1